MRTGNSDNPVEILDTTLRDGEQTPGVSFSPAEKLQLARFLLGQLRVDRIEIGSARVSDGESESVAAILDWAIPRGFADSVELLGFIDNGRSIDWADRNRVRVINFLAKGSEQHCRVQLRRTPRQHYEETAREIRHAAERGFTVNLYLEDWSNGMQHSFGYVHGFLKALEGLPIARLMLPDTLGLLTPEATTRYLEWLMEEFPSFRYDFHAHNDYGLATANSLAAARAGVSGLHATINGLGERAGNQPLAQLAVGLADHTGRHTRIVEKLLIRAAEMVQTFSGKRGAWNTPVTGTDVFTQTCGVHADGDHKGDLYVNALLPERFGRERTYALGKLAGIASIEKNLDEIGLDLTPDTRNEVLETVVRLGDRKKQVAPSDLPFIIADVLNHPVQCRLKVREYSIETRSGKRPRAHVAVEFDGNRVEGQATGTGGYDAFVRALRRILRQLGISMPKLADYEVRIPPGGKTDALVETTITWQQGPHRTLRTTGIDCDQLAAAIRATEKMLNSIL